jgi:hypothetical protein
LFWGDGWEHNNSRLNIIDAKLWNSEKNLIFERDEIY